MGSGFDIVIGNPPYIHFEKMREVSEKLYKPLKFETYEARGDIYTLFYEKGIELLKDKGILTYITSNKWMRAGYGESLRDYFVTKTQPLQLIDLGGGVFESATVDTNILVLRKSDYTEDTVAVAANKDLSPSNMQDFINDHSINLKFKQGESWAILTPIEQSIKEKIEKVGTPLKDWNIKINRGILTGCNEAFIISGEKRDEILANCKTAEERTRTADLIRPILRGRDIKRNGYTFANLYVILAYYGSHEILEKEYPAIYKHLKQYEKDLRNRGQCRYTASGKPRPDADEKGFPGQHHWLELDNNPGKEYLDDFSKQKIVYSEIVREPQFYLDNEGEFMAEATSFLMTGEHLDYLVNWLNSPTIAWIFKRFYAGGGLGDTGYRYKKVFFENLPIPKPNSNNVDYKDNETAIYNVLGLNEDEIKFISSSSKPITE